MLRRFCLIALLVLAPLFSHADDDTDEADPTNERIVQQIHGQEENWQWGGQLGYSIRTDLADQTKPRAYANTIDAGYGFEYHPWRLSLELDGSLEYESVGERRSEILVDDNEKDLFLKDLSLSAGKQFDGPWKSSVVAVLGNEFPTSSDAQREGWTSVTFGDGLWIIPLIEGMKVKLKTEAYYIWNRYRFSPSTHQLNPEGGWRLEASLTYRLWKGLFVQGMVGTSMTQYLDGTADNQSRNAIALGYIWSRYMVMLSTADGTYLDREDANIWFIDEYRRTVRFAAQVTF